MSVQVSEQSPTEDVEGHLVSLQKSIETRLEELEMKETHVKNLLKELESKEKKMNFGSMENMDGKELLILLNEQVGQQEKLHDGVYQALKSCEEPGKLVLDAVEEFYGENGEMGTGWGVVRRSCVVLLEQLTRLRPRIAGQVKAEAARLAREWRAKMRTEEGKKGGVLEVLGFLLLLGAYELVDEFDIGELLSVFESIGQQSGQTEAIELGVELGLADNDPVSTTLDTQEKIDRSSKKELALVNQIASSFASRLEALKSFCVGMNGRSLKLFLYQHVELGHDSLYNEVCDALSHAPDPAKLVLGAIPGFLRSQPEFDKSLSMTKVRKSCIILLEQLLTISPQLSPHVRREALKMADDWGANLGQIYQRPVTVYGFLLFLAAYGLKSNYESDELLRLLGIASQYKASPVLCQVLGLDDKVEVVIQTLIQKTLLLEAIDSMYAYEVVDKFQPVRLLKGYLKYSKKRINKKRNKANLQQDQAIGEEIAVMRTVIKYIVKYKLESEYPPEGLEKQIVELENKKEAKIAFTRMKKMKSNGKMSTIFHSQVKAETSQKEYPELVNQINSFSTGPWPQLESFCISMDGRGSSFLSHDHVEEHNSVASSSSGPWPELKSFCTNMDGKNLRLFLYNHTVEHDSMRSEVCYALQYASDPAKLVLDALPGFLRSQPEFNKSLSLNKVRKSCVLLLEQLITISPVINSHVRVEALKMANEWRANLGQKYQTGLNVYGFLLFLAAYGLKSNHESDELRLLGLASQYKASPVLCQVLGLADKVEVVIQTLIQKTLLLEAIDSMYAYEVVDKFQPVHLLKRYLKYSKKRINKKRNKANLQQDQAIDKEITVMRTVIKYIVKYKLESEYPPEGLEKQVVELENKKEEAKIAFTRTKKMKSNGKSKSLACASTMIHSPVKAETSQKEYSELVNQINSFSTCPLPQLESFCISMDGRGSSFPSHDLAKEHNSVASSSSSSWPELRSFCINMDGKNLRLFLYNHTEEHAYMCSEVCDALQYTSDPAKLVLDALPGFLRSQPEFDNSLSLDKVRKSCVLLLEQLVTLSPKISPHVRVEALKMANEWRANLGQKYQTGLNVYGFLHFVAAYGFTSNYEADELLGFLANANQHKPSPGLCRILGLADKVVDLIVKLIRKNLLLEAIEHIYAFELKDTFQPVNLLKDYLKRSKKRIYKKGVKSVSKQAIDKEIEAVRTVMNYIAKYKLESECRPQNLENYIIELEKQKRLM